MGIRSAISSLFNKSGAEPDGVKYLVQVTADGFVPAAQFAGNNLELLLTQAVWSYVCMTRLAEDVASLPGIVQEMDDSGEWVTDKKREHDLNQVLLRPWGAAPAMPRQGWPWLTEVVSLQHDLAGAALLRIVPDSDMDPTRLLALQLLPPPGETKGQERPDGSGMLASWLLPGGQSLLPKQVVNIAHANPGSLWRGLSPLEAADRSILIDWTAQQRTKYDLEQRVGAGMMVKVKALFTMSKDQRQNVKDELSTNHSLASQTGLPWVVGDSVDVAGLPEQTTLKDIPEHRRMAMQEIASVFKIPLPVLGVIDRAAYNQYELALQAYWTLALQPKLLNVYQAVNEQAVWPIYGPRVRLWYDTTDNAIGLAVARLKARAAKDYLDLGYPANAVNTRFALGMPAYAELERPNMAAVVAGRGDPGRPEDEPFEPEEEQETSDE